MMGSASRRALYTGVTALLYERVSSTKTTLAGISRVNTNAIVWSREKEIKGWRREKKDRLVESVNPGWKDLAADWYPERLLKDGVPVEFEETKHKVPRAYSRADNSARSRNGPRDDVL